MLKQEDADGTRSFADPQFRADVLAGLERARSVEVARAIAGDVDVAVMPMMAGEDFSYMLEQRPGAYIFVGNGDSAQLHHPAYDFNDEAIPWGVSYWCMLVRQRLPLA